MIRARARARARARVCVCRMSRGEERPREARARIEVVGRRSRDRAGYVVCRPSPGFPDIDSTFRRRTSAAGRGSRRVSRDRSRAIRLEQRAQLERRRASERDGRKRGTDDSVAHDSSVFTPGVIYRYFKAARGRGA